MQIDRHTALFLFLHCLSVPKLLYTLRSSPRYTDQEYLHVIEDASAGGKRPDGATFFRFPVENVCCGTLPALIFLLPGI